MNELFDKLIIRIFFTIFICGILVLYKYAHHILYPSSREQVFKIFLPTKNAADTIHLFSRIIGIGILFSEFYFYISEGIFYTLISFLIQAILVFSLYLISIYILESIVLYNFDYHDEILKRKNFAYAVVSFANALAVAFVLKSVLIVCRDSFILLFLLWLFAIMILGLASKSFSLISRLAFNKLVIQKNLGIAFSYSGFILGWAVIVASALYHDIQDIKWYTIQVVLKILLSVIIFPIFRKGLVFIFKIQSQLPEATSSEEQKMASTPELGYGIFEGAIFYCSCYLTTIITGHIHFGSFYPA